MFILIIIEIRNPAWIFVKIIESLNNKKKDLTFKQALIECIT